MDQNNVEDAELLNFVFKMEENDLVGPEQFQEHLAVASNSLDSEYVNEPDNSNSHASLPDSSNSASIENMSVDPVPDVGSSASNDNNIAFTVPHTRGDTVAAVETISASDNVKHGGMPDISINSAREFIEFIEHCSCH